MNYYQQVVVEEVEEDVHIVERINSMLLHERKTTSNNTSYNFNSEVNAACRKAMIDWCFTVCDAFDSLQRETVGISASILDRYLSSKRGSEALLSRQRFQLTSITCFYIAIKTHESVALSLDMLIKLCRGWYTAEDIVAMELEILSALEWRVSLSTVTPMDYVRHFLELLRPHQLVVSREEVANVLLEHASKHMDNATADAECCSYKSSSIGVVCLAGALNDTYELSQSEKNELWSQLSQKLPAGFDIASNEIRTVEMKLLLTTKRSMMDDCEFKMQSPSASFTCGVPSSSGEEIVPASPVSVLQGV